MADVGKVRKKVAAFYLNREYVGYLEKMRFLKLSLCSDSVAYKK